MGGAIIGCIGHRRRIVRAHRRAPGRPLCARTHRRVRSRRLHDLGRRLLDRLAARIRRRGRTQVMAADRRGRTQDRRQSRRQTGLPIRIGLPIRTGLPIRIGRQTREFARCPVGPKAGCAGMQTVLL
jgi:hypothetical protein